MNTRGAQHDVRHGRPDTVSLTSLVDDWTASGVITPAQASRMTRDAAGVRVLVHEDRSALVVEGLAYLGGVLVLCACGLLVSQWWPDLSTAWRLTLVGAPAAGLVLAGTAIPASTGHAGVRLRVALWLVGAVGVGAFLSVVGQSLGLDELVTTALSTAGTAVVGFVLWRVSGAVLLQLLTLAALMVTAAASAAELVDAPAAPGVSAWTVATGWLLLSLLAADGVGVVRPAAAAGAVGSALSTTAYDGGVVLTLLTVGGCVTLALLRRELGLLVVGALGLLLLLPIIATRWFPDTLGAPIAMLAVGLVTVLFSLLAARRMSRGSPRP